MSERSERVRRYGLSGGGVRGADSAHRCPANANVVHVTDDVTVHR